MTLEALLGMLLVLGAIILVAVRELGRQQKAIGREPGRDDSGGSAEMPPLDFGGDGGDGAD